MATNNNNSFTKKQTSNNTTNTTASASVNHNAIKQSHHVNALYCTSIGTTVTEASLEVYTSGFKEVFIVPERDIVHMPDAEILKNVARLILCTNFRAQDPERSCRMGKRCRFVHADLAHALNHNIHINYAWRSIDQVAYERFDESFGQLEVAPPNGQANMLIAANCILKTNAISDPRRPLSHCAHYYYSRACNRGPECSFIHAVYVDADARDHQRAPAPSRDKHGLTAQYPAILHNDHQADYRLSPNQPQPHQRNRNNGGSDGGDRPTSYGLDSEDSTFLAVCERNSGLTLPSAESQHSLDVSCNDEEVSSDEELPTALSFISEDTTLEEGIDAHKQTNPLEPQKQQQRSHLHRSQQQRDDAEGFHSSTSARQSKDECCLQSFAHDDEEFIREANTSDGCRTGSANCKASSAAALRHAFLPRLVGPRNSNNLNGSHNDNDKRSSDGEQPNNTRHAAAHQTTNRFTNAHEKNEKRAAATIRQHDEEEPTHRSGNTLTAPQRFRYNPYSSTHTHVVV